MLPDSERQDRQHDRRQPPQSFPRPGETEKRLPPQHRNSEELRQAQQSDSRKDQEKPLRPSPEAETRRITINHRGSEELKQAQPTEQYARKDSDKPTDRPLRPSPEAEKRQLTTHRGSGDLKQAQHPDPEKHTLRPSPEAQKRTLTTHRTSEELKQAPRSSPETEKRQLTQHRGSEELTQLPKPRGDSTDRSLRHTHRGSEELTQPPKRDVDGNATDQQAPLRQSPDLDPRRLAQGPLRQSPESNPRRLAQPLKVDIRVVPEADKQDSVPRRLTPRRTSEELKQLAGLPGPLLQKRGSESDASGATGPQKPWFAVTFSQKTEHLPLVKRLIPHLQQLGIDKERIFLQDNISDIDQERDWVSQWMVAQRHSKVAVCMLSSAYLMSRPCCTEWKLIPDWQRLVICTEEPDEMMLAVDVNGFNGPPLAHLQAEEQTLSSKKYSEDQLALKIYEKYHANLARTFEDDLKTRHARRVSMTISTALSPGTSPSVSPSISPAVVSPTGSSGKRGSTSTSPSNFVSVCGSCFSSSSSSAVATTPTLTLPPTPTLSSSPSPSSSVSPSGRHIIITSKPKASAKSPPQQPLTNPNPVSSVNVTRAPAPIQVNLPTNFTKFESSPSLCALPLSKTPPSPLAPLPLGLTNLPSSLSQPGSLPPNLPSNPKPVHALPPQSGSMPPRIPDKRDSSSDRERDSASAVTISLPSSSFPYLASPLSDDLVPASQGFALAPSLPSHLPPSPAPPPSLPGVDPPRRVRASRARSAPLGQKQEDTGDEQSEDDDNIMPLSPFVSRISSGSGLAFSRSNLE